jgi:hypothetical protein
VQEDQPPEPTVPSGAAPDRSVEGLVRSAVTWARPALIPVVAYLISRVMVLAAAGLATWIHPDLTIARVIDGWDGGWYLTIAAHGYPATLAQAQGGGRWAFYPGVPAILHAAVVVTGMSYFRAGEVVGFVLGLTAVLSVWLAARQALGAVAADRTAIFLCFFPAAYVLSMPYSEGLLLTAVGLCLYFLGRRSWLAAGLAASVAGLSRDPGVVLILVCAVVGVREVVATRSWRPLIAVVTAPLGFLAWLVIQWRETGNPLAFLHAGSYWGQGLQWFGYPVEALWHLVSIPAIWGQANEVLGGLSVLFVLITAGMIVWEYAHGRGIPLSWSLYAAGAVLVALGTHWGGSEPRYVMAAFPLLAIAAVRIPRRFETPVIAGLAMLEAALAVVAFTTLATSGTAPFAP